MLHFVRLQRAAEAWRGDWIRTTRQAAIAACQAAMPTRAPTQSFSHLPRVLFHGNKGASPEAATVHRMQHHCHPLRQYLARHLRNQVTPAKSRACFLRPAAAQRAHGTRASICARCPVSTLWPQAVQRSSAAGSLATQVGRHVAAATRLFEHGLWCASAAAPPAAAAPAVEVAETRCRPAPPAAGRYGSQPPAAPPPVPAPGRYGSRAPVAGGLYATTPPAAAAALGRYGSGAPRTAGGPVAAAAGAGAPPSCALTACTAAALIIRTKHCKLLQCVRRQQLMAFHQTAARRQAQRYYAAPGQSQSHEDATHLHDVRCAKFIAGSATVDGTRIIATHCSARVRKSAVSADFLCTALHCTVVLKEFQHHCCRCQ
jgi:hypothetical protein